MSTIRARKKARELLLQAIYQWQLSATDLDDLVVQFLHENDQSKFDVDYFHQVLTGLIDKINELDQAIQPVLDRAITELNPIELAVLRLGTYELLFRIDIPYRVAINEALELTKKYGSAEGHKYVNGVLDKLARACRPKELKI